MGQNVWQTKNKKPKPERQQLRQMFWNALLSNILSISGLQTRLKVQLHDVYRRGDIISCCYVIECHRYYDKVGTILTANLIKKLIEIQYAVYSDIIANCISQNRYEIKCTCRSLSLRTVWYAYNLYHLLFQESLQFPKFN